MRGNPNTQTLSILAVNTAAAGGASTITLAAPASGEGQHVIDFVSGSYGAAPSAGILTITNCASATNTALTWSTDITAAGAFLFTFPPSGLRCLLETAVVINLTDGGQAKDLDVGYR